MAIGRVLQQEIQEAVEALRAGELVAFPTETVYGLGANANNPDAVRKIFRAKDRPSTHPVIVHIDHPRYLQRWVREMPPEAKKLADAFWPGPLTLVAKRAPAVNDVITGGQDTVAIRVPNHPVAQQLLNAFGGGIAAPSANRYGHREPDPRRARARGVRRRGQVRARRRRLQGRAGVDDRLVRRRRAARAASRQHHAVAAAGSRADDPDRARIRTRRACRARRRATIRRRRR